MKFTQIQINHFRNLTKVEFYPSQCNLFLGENGSGKTSVLESIYLLSRGKSFRHHQPKHYIQYDHPTTLIFANLDDNGSQSKVAIEKSQKAETWLRLNGQTLSTQSLLTQILPILLLEPISLNNLELGSQSRREILDWLVFHVEQNFFSHWQMYQRLLKQRNIWLKQQKLYEVENFFKHQEILAWNQQLGEHAHWIHHHRQTVLERWQPYFLEQLGVFLPSYQMKVKLRYMAGFDSEMDFAEILTKRLAKDIDLGYTRLGCHRADMNVVLHWQENDDEQKYQQLNATDMLSRGERKMLMMALRLSQLPLLNSVGKQPIVLLDDITAELDQQSLQLLLMGLKQVNSQLFITSLSTDMLSLVQKIWQNDVKVFHVEQGRVFSDHE